MEKRMKTTLTDEEQHQLDEYRAYCLARGRATDEIDKPKIETALTQMYALIGKPAPRFVYCDSVLQAQQVISELSGDTSYHDTSFWGQQDYYWVSYYRFAERYLGVQYTPGDTARLALWETLADSAHWFWPYETTCIVSHKPTALTVDPRGRLHNDSGPAIQYRDGYAQYYLHGVSVPKELAEIKKSDMSPADLGKYKNAEVRMQFIKKLGVDRLREHGKKIDSRGVYQLIDMHSLFDGVPYAPYLFMTNPSTGETHAEGVAPECHTVTQAINWRAGDIARTWDPLELT
jgi:hypothetical protein